MMHGNEFTYLIVITTPFSFHKTVEINTDNLPLKRKDNVLK